MLSQSAKALVFSAALLLATMSMAAALSWGRRSSPAGEVVAPPGWRISFRPPARWTPLPANRLDQGMLAFAQGNGIRRGRLLVVQREKDPPWNSPERNARRFYLQLSDVGPLNLLHVSPTPHVVAFGPLEGVAIEDVERGIGVVAAVVDGEAYAIALVGDQLFTEPDSALLRSVVSSVRLGGP